MKKILFLMLLLGILFVFIACDNGNGGDDPTPQTVTYSGTAGGTAYTLKITENLNRAAYTPQAGDSYELTAGTKKSTGTVDSYSNGTFTLKPEGSATTFTASVSSSGLTGFTGGITWEGDSTPTTLPTEVTPPPPPNGETLSGTYTKGDIFILNNIQESKFKDTNPYIHYTVDDKWFFEELSNGLGREIDEKYDPQKVAADVRPNYYVYMVDNDYMYFAIHLYYSNPFTKTISEYYNKMELSNTDSEEYKLYTYSTLKNSLQYNELVTSINIASV